MKDYKAGDMVVCVQHPDQIKSGTINDMNYAGGGWAFEKVFTVNRISKYPKRDVLWPEGGGSGVFSDHVLPLLEYIAKKYPVGTEYKCLYHTGIFEATQEPYIYSIYSTSGVLISCGCGCVYSKEKGFAEIISKPVQPEEDWKLPEKWCIKRDRDNYQQINVWLNKNSQTRNKEYEGDNLYVHYPVLSDSHIYFKVMEGYTEITFDQFLKHVVKMENNKKIIGYKCPMDLFKNSASEVKSGTVFIREYDCERAYHPEGSSCSLHCMPAEIVEQWEPVYEKLKPELPEINGYKGQPTPNREGAKYGCATIWKESLAHFVAAHTCSDPARRIVSFKLSSGVEITVEQAEQIIAALEYKDN